MKKRNYTILMFATLTISICSIIYELIISGVSSYLLGDSIRQFSITIGLYLSAMGIGSYLSRFIKTDMIKWLICIEVAIGVVGGFSSLVLFVSNIYTKVYVLIMYLLIIIIGILVGLEIPILARIIEENKSNIRENLANIFTFDYIGSLLGAIAFPLILLPAVGFVTTSFLIGFINLIIAVIISFSFNSSKKQRIGLIILSAILFIFMLFGQNITRSIEQGLYRDDVIKSIQTKYQKIVVTKHKDDLRLFINGNLQFSSVDEYRYHEPLVHIPMSLASQRKRVLILGGGDGMAAREILKYDDVQSIVLVDIDEEMIKLCKEDSQITSINDNSLNSEKIKIINNDAYLFVKDNQEKFDVIIVDLPDPNTEVLSKLYSNVFYNYVKVNLTDNGIMVVQSSSPYYAKKTFWCINKTINEQFNNVLPYCVDVPSFGKWGFNLASNREIDIDNISINFRTRYLNDSLAKGLFVFANDEMENADNIKINSFFNPVLMEYYNSETRNW